MVKDGERQRKTVEDGCRRGKTGNPEKWGGWRKLGREGGGGGEGENIAKKKR